MKKNYLNIYLLLAVVGNCFSVFSQCATDGPKSPTTFINDASSGTVPWTNLSNVAASDNARSTASAVVGILSSSYTNNLIETGFGFSLPAGVSICGIQIDVERREQGVIVGSSVKDNSIKIVKGGVIVGNDHSSAASWPSADAVSSYGGPGDLWGTTWTVADINSGNFGIAYASASLNTGLAALLLSAEIDNITLKVYYDASGLPIELMEFNATCQGKQNVGLNWVVASQKNNDFFTIERSVDGVEFEKIGAIAGAGNTEYKMNYSFIDNNANEDILYYRLKQTDFNKEFKYSDIISAECGMKHKPIIYPNPSSGKFNIKAFGELLIYNANGEEIYSQKNIYNSSQIDLSHQPKGMYFYQIKSSNELMGSGTLVIE